MGNVWDSETGKGRSPGGIVRGERSEGNDQEEMSVSQIYDSTQTR